MCRVRPGFEFSDRPSRKEQNAMAWFYEIHSSTNTVLKRDVGFATQVTAKTAGCENAKKMKNTLRRNQFASFGRALGI